MDDWCPVPIGVKRSVCLLKRPDRLWAPLGILRSG